MVRPIKPRKDNLFYNLDKPDYSYLISVMNRNRVK